jgi:CRISPR-associated endonuclease/helicase Cas3
MTKSTPSYYKYWGKADKDTGKYHLLPYHCLDVAAVVSRSNQNRAI